MNIIDILFIICLLLLYFLPKKSEKHKYYYAIPLFIFLVGIGIRIHSKIENHKNSEKIKNLDSQIIMLEKDRNAKEQKISELEKKARLLRSIEGSIECLISANWDEGDHPGDIFPISWNKAQFYVRVFEENVTDNSAFLFYLDSFETTKLSEDNLKVKLMLKANSSSGPFGQELDVLKKYTHLLVNIPFIHKDDVLDEKIILRNLKATFIINGEFKTQIDHADNFEIPLPDGNKLAVFQLNKKDMFNLKNRDTSLWK